MSAGTILLIAIAALILDIVCGVVASNMGRKFSSYFTTSLLFTPIIGFVILLSKGRISQQETEEAEMLMPHVFICPTCKNIYIGTTSIATSTCANCNSPTIETHFSAATWEQYSENEQQEILANIISNQPQQNDSNPQPTDAADEILKYKKLLDCGAITQEEYDAKKKQLLDM